MNQEKCKKGECNMLDGHNHISCITSPKERVIIQKHSQLSVSNYHHVGQTVKCGHCDEKFVDGIETMEKAGMICDCKCHSPKEEIHPDYCQCNKCEPKEEIVNDWEREEWGGWKIISDMLDNPDENGIYPTSEAYKKLYDFVVEQKQKTISSTEKRVAKLCCKDCQNKIQSIYGKK